MLSRKITPQAASLINSPEVLASTLYTPNFSRKKIGKSDIMVGVKRPVDNGDERNGKRTKTKTAAVPTKKAANSAPVKKVVTKSDPKKSDKSNKKDKKPVKKVEVDEEEDDEDDFDLDDVSDSEGDEGSDAQDEDVDMDVGSGKADSDEADAKPTKSADPAKSMRPSLRTTFSMIMS